MGDYFTKHHPPHHHREISATYSYMENDLLKIDHKVVQAWVNVVLTPIYMVALTLNTAVMQGCEFRTYVHMYVHTNTTPVMYTV